MKKVWNVYQREDGMRVAISPSSQRDTELTDEPGYTFLGQVTEEIEELKKEPKKEVEKVRMLLPITIPTGFENRFQLIIGDFPKNAYDFELHYKIKE